MTVCFVATEDLLATALSLLNYYQASETPLKRIRLCPVRAESSRTGLWYPRTLALNRSLEDKVEVSEMDR